MHFGEYELFPSLIGLSPLSTTHPKTFQRQLVRSSIACYRDFNLVMDRSQGFASTPSDFETRRVLSLRPIQTRFRFGSGSENLNLAKEE